MHGLNTASQHCLGKHLFRQHWVERLLTLALSCNGWAMSLQVADRHVFANFAFPICSTLGHFVKKQLNNAQQN